MDLASAAQAAIDEATAGQPDCLAHLQVDGNTHGVWDRGRIEQLLQNLLGNALQHGANHRQVTLSLSGASDTVTLTVHNYGPAIPEQALGTIFDPLVRSATEEIGQATTSLGLGLFIVKEVVNAHQGSIEVRSSEADGTHFIVVLPRVSRA